MWVFPKGLPQKVKTKLYRRQKNDSITTKKYKKWPAQIPDPNYTFGINGNADCTLGIRP